jgi:NitT/TauT family transport system ATP-binding protein
MNEAVMTVSGVRKEFVTKRGEAIRALDRVDFEVFPNDFICIVGPSGCGKSTLLRILAGLEQATFGSAEYRGQPVTSPHHDLGMVFQEYSLFPWRTVIDNVTLGLEFQGWSAHKRYESGQKYLRLIGMEKFAHAYPHELSGGMRQRVAIARALANEPDVLLMDEPFGALDAHTRILLQKELLSIWEYKRSTILFVTHSVDEAIYLADRILVMSARPGRFLKEIRIEMARPRDRAMPEYGRMAADILDMLEQEVVMG